MKVGIIIVTYNSEKDISRLLESIAVQEYKNLVVYIIDNNSCDGTLNLIDEYKNRISLSISSLKTNNGFAKGNNIGIQKAMDEGCDLVFILNPDIQLDKRCIDILVQRIKLDEKIGAVGPIVLIGNQPENITQAYGVNVNFKTQKKTDLFVNLKLTDEIPAEIFVDFLLGGAMMIRSNVLKITGLFEEDYFMYNDEIDIAYRIKSAGFRTLCMRDAMVWHYHDFNKKNKTGNNLMYYYMIRNKFLYFKKYHLYMNLFTSVLIEFIYLPVKIIWAMRRIGNVKLIKYYYLGLWRGLIGETGKTRTEFK